MRLQAVVGLSAGWARPRQRTGSSRGRLTTIPLVAHVAVKALVALNAVPACLAALDPATPKLAPGAARALQAMHCPEAVDGLIGQADELERSHNPPACVQVALPAGSPRGRIHRRLVDDAARYQRTVLTNPSPGIRRRRSSELWAMP